jgi:hypothetical protein
MKHMLIAARLHRRVGVDEVQTNGALVLSHEDAQQTRIWWSKAAPYVRQYARHHTVYDHACDYLNVIRH